MTGGAAEVAVATTGLTKRFGRTTALQDVDLAVRRGEVLGYLGPNGAGKTTTLRLLMGFLRPTSGSARVLGLDAWRDAARVHADVGYVGGEPALHDRLTGREHVRATARLRGGDGPGRAPELAGRLDLDLDRPARELSKGNRQKLALVLAMMSDPPLLVLDEPTSGFDPLAQQEFQALLRAHTATGGAALLSSHVLGEVQRSADRIGVLRAGRLVAVEAMEDLPARSLHRVRARFEDEVPAGDFAGLPGLRDVVVSGTALSCSAPASALDALCRRMATHRLADLECTEADLEETFLAYYGTERAGAA
ncbi:ABC transporter ATP-binding protein [Blastococcus sp. TML/M2B]|uniref:ABC transporter ATP-binding protein n=1 Tax=unclassified Blastococcus TaxID=2619396 RepID=UPI00190BEC50|nr:MULTISPECIES: ABC transporter ATP-binding protein [unclassified Blastococcus]MBN1093233.1 ABC transporter ATP-binding protein [Blastococcus sp. TML/M2B]MBN1096656.1 ABC transporter ATP-binding protein [Blastococcus sp. TML/C7B]